jgi:hypothetical protein
MIRNDLRADPVRRLVVMGESNAYGMCASEPANEWVQVLANAVRRFQSQPVRVFNNAIPANVISPDAPGYEQGRFGVWPSAIERFERDMLAYAPDMAVYAYGLNDSRCGHAVESFMAAYRTIAQRTRASLPGALIVLVGPYWNLQYDAATWATPKYRNWIFGKFDRAGDDLVKAYNRELAGLASEVGGLFVDVYAMLEGATWLLNADACHFNDVGQAMIGHRVFCEVAAHCSFLATRSQEIERKLRLSTRNTGGTEALAEVVERCRKSEGWAV